MDIKLLIKLCEVFSPAGNENRMTSFILRYVNENHRNWSVKPRIFSGENFQNCVILEFGTPSVAVFAHIDTTGFTARYENQLVPIGSPDVQDGYIVVGEDSLGPIECALRLNEDNHVLHDFGRGIARGTELVFKPDFKEGKNYIQSPYLDNRVGIFNALKLAEIINNGLIVFSCYEEQGGGSVSFLIKYIYEKYHINKVLISDVTWVTDGIHPGKGVVVSLRDRYIPRKSYVNQIINIAEKSGIDFQVEVEGSGSSDGGEIQLSPYPVDWCFVGPPEERVHSPFEKIHKKDVTTMIDLYKILIENL